MVMTMMDNKTALDMIPEADKYILVDSENVGSYWLDMYDQEKENDDDYDAVVIVLYTDFTPYMSYEDCFRLAENRDRFIPIKCYAGEKAASALDFQLVSIAVFLMKEYSESEYIILSKDKGYDPMVRFWQDAGYYVTREVPTKLAADTASEQMELTDVIVAQPDSTTAGLSKKEKKRRRDAIVVGALPNADKDTRTKVKAIMGAYSPENKNNNIYLTVIKQFGQKQGLDIYHAIKPHLDEFYSIK